VSKIIVFQTREHKNNYFKNVRARREEENKNRRRESEKENFREKKIFEKKKS